MKTRIKNWLSKDALPLWLKNGVDRDRGGFYEALSFQGDVLHLPRRAMVQARQLYSFRVAIDLGFIDIGSAAMAMNQSAAAFVRDFSHPSGGFFHSVDENLKPLNTKMDLYGQAFALFGLAQAQIVNRRSGLKTRAIELVDYLKRERRAPAGGFTELDLKSGDVLYQSNPHMHLLEAALAWRDIDDDPRWAGLADEIVTLALEKFIDPATGWLGEHFRSDWTLERENGLFVFEPGHQYEWSWLLGWHARKSTIDTGAVGKRLYQQSERHGLSQVRRSVHDQMWSDLSPKLSSSRFWPQGERIKAACQQGDLRAADEACGVLFRFLETPKAGLWFDTWEANGEFRPQPVKASSLYHIIGAFSERLLTHG